MGAFQRLLLFVAGLGLAADTIELFVVAYVIPSAEVELCMSGTDKGWLGMLISNPYHIKITNFKYLCHCIYRLRIRYLKCINWYNFSS